jgi:hypothetical protein
MAWEIGWTGKCKIVRNGIETIGDKDAVKIYVEHPDTGDTGSALIFMTAKSMGMARAALKACGFDPDLTSLAVLVTDEEHLAGREVPIFVDEYNGKVQLRIETRRVPTPSMVKTYDALLKKKASDAPLNPPDQDELPF